MAQTRMGSFAESWANIGVGFTVNFAANMLILPAFGFTTLTLVKNFQLGALYTVISLARSYVLRRWFNGLKFGNTPPPHGTLPPPWWGGLRGYRWRFEAFVADNWGTGDDLRDLFIMTSGLAGETGEVCELLKKDVRGRPGQALDRRKLLLELGDVIHYATRIAQRHGLDLDSIFAANMAKLARRRAHGKDEDAELEIAARFVGEQARAAA